MIPITAAVSGKLSWARLSFRSEYQLQFNQQIAGTLTRPSIWSSRRIATTQAGEWIIRRTGFSGGGAEIMDSGSGQVVATYRSGWWGKGTFTFTDGQKFSLEVEGFFRPVWKFVAETGEPVVRIYTRGGTIELSEGIAIPSTRLSLLIMFGLNCILLSEENAGAAAVMAGGS